MSPNYDSMLGDLRRLLQTVEEEHLCLSLKLARSTGTSAEELPELLQSLAKKQATIRNIRRHIGKIMRGRDDPPEAGLAQPAIPPRGPLPKQGGAAAALDFD
jgi:hypothetical protein